MWNGNDVNSNWDYSDYDWTEKDRYDFVDINRTDSDFLWTSGGTDNDDVIIIDEDPITESAFTINLVSAAVNILRTPLVSTDVLKRITVETFDATQSVGTYGPGGGKIFYYSAAGFNCGSDFSATGSPTGGKCHFLEAAPTTGVNSWKDAAYVWSGNTNTLIGTTGTAIGSGYKNSLAIVEQNGNDAETSAAVAARAYRGPYNLYDWFLPSKDELNQMCKWVVNGAWSDATVCFGGTINTGPGAAGFVEVDYWSSSESNAYYAWVQYFSVGGQDTVGVKANTFYVRPVRAF
jgi:hypothetical protein